MERRPEHARGAVIQRLAAEPFGVRLHAEVGIRTRQQRAVALCPPERARERDRRDPGARTLGPRPTAHHVGEALLAGPREIADPPGRGCFGQDDQPGGDLARRDRLGAHPRRDMQRPDRGAAVDLRGELVELCRAQDRPGHRAVLDQALLRELSRVVALGCAVDPDDREREVMSHGCRCLGIQERTGRGLEERDGLLRVERVDAHGVDDGIRARQRFGESAAGEQVDAAAARENSDVVPALARDLGDVAAHAAGPSGDGDSHARPSGVTALCPRSSPECPRSSPECPRSSRECPRSPREGTLGGNEDTFGRGGRAVTAGRRCRPGPRGRRACRARTRTR